MYNKLVIGIDQSYKNTGISLCADNDLKKVGSVYLENLKSNSEKRLMLRERLDKIIRLNINKANEVQIIIERIRLSSQGFINIDYIKSIGALNSIIVDTAREYNLKVYSVDTRSWKSNVVGTSKEQKNSLGVDPKKWPTILYVESLGFHNSIIREVSARKVKGVFIEDGKRYIYNDDAADSACIALYGFLPKSIQLLKEEH